MYFYSYALQSFSFFFFSLNACDLTLHHFSRIQFSTIKFFRQALMWKKSRGIFSKVTSRQYLNLGFQKQGQMDLGPFSLHRCSQLELLVPSSSHGMVPLACVVQYGACTEESQLFLLSAVRALAAAAGYPEMTFI